VFGTLCFAKIKKSADKFAPRGRKCLFVGYLLGQKGWKVFDLETQEFFVSKDVVFHENSFPYQTIPHPSKPQLTLQPHPTAAAYSDEEEWASFGARGSTDMGHPGSTPDNLEHTVTGPDPELGASASSRPPEPNPTEEGPPSESGPAHTVPPSPADQPAPVSGLGRDTCRSDRPSKRPVRYDDYLCYSTRPNDPTAIDCSSRAGPHPKESSGTRYPIAHYVTSNKFLVSYQNFLATLTWEVESKYFQEVVTDPR